MNEFTKTAVKAAKEAGKIIMSQYGRAERLSDKSEKEILTKADLEAEKKIISTIKESFPDHSIYSEEKGKEETSSDYCWIIDPIDGTTNFAHGLPFFCTAIGLKQGEEIILGVVLDPFHEELFVAEKGKGAFMNGKRISVSRKTDLRDCFFATGFAYERGPLMEKTLSLIKTFLVKSKSFRRLGSAALDMCFVSCGRFDFYWEYNLRPWDIAASSIIVKEAGGTITQPDGTALPEFPSHVLASNGLLHEGLIKIINDN
ncbi:MAG: inositol monophosphatase family protein [archaeon]